MKKLLLHSCCGPCSTHVINVLKDSYDITIFYYNPNIDTNEEYQLRLNEQKRFCSAINVPVLEVGYNAEEFLQFVKGYEKEKEGGARCSLCFQLRLDRTAKEAKLRGFDCFATTLTVSPHKNSIVINSIGKEIEKVQEVPFIDGNLKKQDGYKKSIDLSRQYNLYRQNYCGCQFSKRMQNGE